MVSTTPKVYAVVTGLSCRSLQRRQILGLQAPFDLDVAQLAALEGQRHRAEKPLGDQGFQICDQLLHTRKIGSELRGGNFGCVRICRTDG